MTTDDMIYLLKKLLMKYDNDRGAYINLDTGCIDGYFDLARVVEEFSKEILARGDELRG